MAERQEFSFNVGELENVVSTDEVIDAGENFLNSDLDNISIVKKTKTKPKEQLEEEEQKQESEEKKKSPKQTKEVVTVPKRLNEDDFFNVLQTEDEETEDAEQEEEIPETVVPKKPKKEVGQQTPADQEEGSDQETEPSEEGESNMFSVLARDLVEHGIFTLDEDEEDVAIASPEELLARFQYEAKKSAGDTLQKFIGRFGPDYQDMFNSVYVNGVSPQDYLSRYSRIVDISQLDIEDEASQEQIVREMYRSEGRSSEYIEKQVSKLKNYGDLSEEAKEAQRILVTKQQTELKQLEEKKADEIRRKSTIKQEFVENITNVLNDKIKTKEFDGIPVDRNFAQSTFEYLTKERYQTKTGELLTEFDKDLLDLNRPDKHDMKVKVAMLMQLLREDPKLSKLAKRAVSKETNELFKHLRKEKPKSAPVKKQTQEPQSWFNNNA